VPGDENIIVEIKCQCTIERHKTDGTFVVRFAGLGLTAFGDTREEAWASFQELFERCIQTYRDHDMLERVFQCEGIIVEPQGQYFGNTSVAPRIPLIKYWISHRASDWESVHGETRSPEIRITV
jgi:predicted RNase H-like HicB family nuclease